MKQIDVYKGRTNVVLVSLGYDVSGEIIRSQIRENIDPTSELIAEWTVGFVTDGTDGELRLSLDNSVTSTITKSTGYMDMLRMAASEPISVFDDVIQVLFKNVVTV